MRILFVTHNIPRHAGDAAGSFVLRLAVALQSLGAAVTVIAPGAAGLAAVDHIEGVAIHRVRYGSDANMTLAYGGTMAETVRGSWRGKFALLALLRALRASARAHLDDARRARAPFDVVHAHWWFPSALALWGMRGDTLPPLVITMHGSDVRLAQGIAPAQRLMRSVLVAARACTAVSTWLADAATRIAPAARVQVMPMPVDADRFVPPAATAVRTGILFVGRLNAQKGLAVLLQALSQPVLADASLDVVGDGPDAASLRALSESLGVHARVRWHGALAQSALVPRYQQARVLAMPSREEGLGLVAVEAQLCETPVVAFASGGLPDVVLPDAGGTLVEADNAPALADAIARLLGDAALSAEAGRIARTRMLESFSPAGVGARYLALYRDATTAQVQS